MRLWLDGTELTGAASYTVSKAEIEADPGPEEPPAHRELTAGDWDVHEDDPRPEVGVEGSRGSALYAKRHPLEADPGPEALHPHTCPRCGGGGEVHWNPSPINDPQLEQSATCPRCDGSGIEPGTGAST
jgi:hypothetical protein